MELILRNYKKNERNLSLKSEFYFRYFEEQWTHIRHHENQRTALTLQLLILIAALIASFLQSTNIGFRVIISIIIITLGTLGFVIFLKTREVTKKHMKRERKALEFLIDKKLFEDFPENTKTIKFPKLHIYYAAFYLIIIISGIAFLITSALSYF